MNNFKRSAYITIICLFMSAGLYMNFELDRDFLSQFGFSGFFVVVSISFFIGIKILTEFLFFRLKGISKYLVGSFALFVIIGSILSIFFVRIYKSESMFQAKENINQVIDKQNQDITLNRSLLIGQISSIDNLIITKTKMIQDLDSDNKWLKHAYSKDIDKLNNDKLALIKEVSNIKNNEIPLTEKTTNLHEALNHVFGFESKGLTIGVNLLFTIFVDFALIFLTFGLSYVIGRQGREHNKNDSDFEVKKQANGLYNPIREHKVNLVNSVNVNPENDIVAKLQKAMSESNLSQSDFAKEKLGISRVALWKIETGRTKAISNDVRSRIEKLVT